MRKVLVIDTSVLYVWLKVSGKETCGPSNALVTYEMVSEKIEEEKKKGTTFILPLATIIETGNHIAHSSGDRMSLGEEFAQIMIDSADEKSPWAAFTEQSSLWNPENLKKLAEKWKITVIGGQALGDASIVEVVKYYTDLGYEVEIFTGDEGLKAYEPTVEIPWEEESKDVNE